MLTCTCDPGSPLGDVAARVLVRGVCASAGLVLYLWCADTEEVALYADRMRVFGG